MVCPSIIATGDSFLGQVAASASNSLRDVYVSREAIAGLLKSQRAEKTMSIGDLDIAHHLDPYTSCLAQSSHRRLQQGRGYTAPTMILMNEQQRDATDCTMLDSGQDAPAAKANNPAPLRDRHAATRFADSVEVSGYGKLVDLDVGKLGQ
jgi:hypothetical protein